LQKAIDQRKWLDLPYACWVIGWSALLIWLVEFGRLPDGFKQLLLGAFLVIFGILVANHLSNLLLFWYLSNQSGPMASTAVARQQRVVSIAMYHIAPAMVLLVLIAMSTRSNFACGAVLGTILLLCNHLQWARQVKRTDALPHDRLGSPPQRDRRA
jgi:hypothetical protein